MLYHNFSYVNLGNCRNFRVFSQLIRPLNFYPGGRNMEYIEYIPLNRTTPDTQFHEYFKKLFVMPKDFDPKDKQRITIFGERLKTLLETADKNNRDIKTVEKIGPQGETVRIAVEGPKHCDVTTAKQLANRLNVTASAVSQYIHGANPSVPCHFFIHLYDIFGATPHYLTGYAKEVTGTLQLDENREPLLKDGKPIELIEPMTYIFSSQRYAYEQFTRLLFESPEHFSTVTDLLYADENVRNGGFAILRTYLDVQENNNVIGKKKKSK